MSNGVNLTWYEVYSSLLHFSFQINGTWIFSILYIERRDQAVYMEYETTMIIPKTEIEWNSVLL